MRAAFKLVKCVTEVFKYSGTHDSSTLQSCCIFDVSLKLILRPFRVTAVISTPDPANPQIDFTPLRIHWVTVCSRVSTQTKKTTVNAGCFFEEVLVLHSIPHEEKERAFFFFSISSGIVTSYRLSAVVYVPSAVVSL